MTIIFFRSKGSQKITSIIVLGLLVGVFFQFAPPEYFERLATITGKEDQETGEVEYEGSAAGRTAMWKGAWHIYKNHPEYWLLGTGIQCYRFMYYDRHSDELYDYLTPREFIFVQFGGSGGKDLHNTFLNFLMGGGAITFLTWMLLLFYAWYQAHTIPRKYPQIVDGVDIHNYARALETGIIGYCACIMFISASTDFFYWYLLMSGIVTNLGKAELKRQELDLEEEFVSIPERNPLYSY